MCNKIVKFNVLKYSLFISTKSTYGRRIVLYYHIYGIDFLNTIPTIRLPSRLYEYCK